MKELNGYLEHNGLIYKIQSIEQLRDFMNSLGEKAKEMTEQELAALCVKPDLALLPQNSRQSDDDLYYSLDGTRLFRGKSYRIYNVNAAVGGVKKEVKIKEGTISVCNRAFNFSELQGRRAIWLPDSIVAIGSFAFCDANVEDIVWSQNLKFIGKSAFSGCNLLATQKGLDLPQSVVFIEAEAFKGCGNMKNIAFPNTIKRIGSHAFENCSSIEWVSLSNSIMEMGSGVFEKCDELQEIRIPKGSRAKFEKLLPFSLDKFVEV